MSLHYLVKKKQVAAECLLRIRTTFSQSVMVSVGMSKLGVTDLIFVDPEAGERHLLPGRVPVTTAVANDADVSAEFFIFQQDSVPAHRARDTATSQASNTCDLWQPNSPDLNPIDYKI